LASPDTFFQSAGEICRLPPKSAGLTMPAISPIVAASFFAAAVFFSRVLHTFLFMG
jgi:hypothetical protein